MKIRIGFVSNSSSTSFTAIYPKTLEPSIIDQLDKFERIVYRNSDINKQKMNDIEYLIYTFWSGNYGDHEIEWLSYVDEDLRNKILKILELDEALDNYDLIDPDRPVPLTEYSEIRNCFSNVHDKLCSIFEDLQNDNKCIINSVDC